jgi:tetratricopeptide (TPR) repeat protein
VIDGGRRSCALVALAAVVAHLTALAGGLIWLDHAHLQEGLALAPVGQLLSLFAHGFAGTGFYRPLMSLSLSLDAALGGAPWLYHAVTLAWHAAAAVLVVLASGALGLSRRAATLAGALFAVHPATSLVASAVAFRSEAMIAVALLALVILHRRERPLAAGLVLLAGALTKETALALGPLLVLGLELERRSSPAARWRLWAAEGAAVAVALALRLAFAPSWRAPFASLTPGEAIGTRLAALGRSTLLVLVPFDRSICDATAITWLRPAALVSAAVLVAVLWLAWRRRGPALLLAISLLPALNLVPIMRWWSPHYLYVPLAFAAMLAAEGVERLSARWPRAAWRSALVVAGALALLSLRDDLRFRTDLTLWEPEVATRPGCREGHFYLGEQARERRQLDQAVLHYRRALEVDPRVLSYVDRGAALQNLGVTHLEQGHLGEAAGAFRAALSTVSDPSLRRRITHNLATTELRAGNPAETARLLEPEVSRPDAFPESIFIRARALHALGRTAEATAHLRRLPRRP